MATPDWAALLDAGDPEGALAAWQAKYPAGIDSLPASWELAEIEERWGDSLFFAGVDGAAAHFHAAWKALMPPGTMFDSAEEGDRRMAAYQRVTNKLYAIDPYGKARAGNTGEAHPSFDLAVHLAKVAAVVVPVPEPVPAPEPATVSAAPSGNDHWTDWDLACRWRDAGKELAPLSALAASQAFSRSLDYFNLYGEAWTAHLPASRWDGDGSEERAEVDQLMKSLDWNLPRQHMPEWVEHLLVGRWQEAVAALPETTGELQLKALLNVLQGTRDAARERL